jgi:hypothetical protein
VPSNESIVSTIAEELGVHGRKALTLYPVEQTCNIVVWSDELTSAEWNDLIQRFGPRVIPKISPSPPPGGVTTSNP